MNYSRQDCIESLQKAADEMGEPLTVKEYRASGYSPSDRTMHERFGSWQNALQTAGLEALKLGINKNQSPPKLRTNREGYEVFVVGVDGAYHRLQNHRLLAVAEYGFDAVCGMDVHHRNGIPWDNRLENLQVMEKSDHVRMHAKQRDLQRDEKGRIVTW